MWNSYVSSYVRTYVNSYVKFVRKFLRKNWRSFIRDFLHKFLRTFLRQFLHTIFSTAGKQIFQEVGNNDCKSVVDIKLIYVYRYYTYSPLVLNTFLIWFLHLFIRAAEAISTVICSDEGDFLSFNVINNLQNKF